MTRMLTLARALKLKNRLTGRLAKIDVDMKQHNCSQAGVETVDVKALYERRKSLVAKLIDLKTAIGAANLPVQADILRLAETKSALALLAGLNTRHGEIVEGYQTMKVTYVAQIRKAEVDVEVVRLEQEADALQERLDAFNHQTTISVDEQIISAASGD